jgi:hypothetical protein
MPRGTGQRPADGGREGVGGGNTNKKEQDHGGELELAARWHAQEREGVGGQAALMGERGRGMRDVHCFLVLM